MEHRFINELLSTGIITSNDTVKLRYGIAVMKSEITKTMGLLGLFFITGHVKPFLFLMLILVPLRMCAGGIHMPSAMGCFLLTAAINMVNLIVLPIIPIGERSYFVILIISIVGIDMLPLVPSKKMPVEDRKKYRTSKAISVFLCLFWSVILLTKLQYTYLAHCGIWALFIQATEMAVAHALIKRKRRIPYAK